MLYEDLRFIHEDVERLEQAIADRVLEEPSHIRHRLKRDHEVAGFLQRMQTQSKRALHIYNHEQESRTQEVQSISTGDPFEQFYKQIAEIKSFHQRYPNEPVENLERAYKSVEDGGSGVASDIEHMFTGEEAFGRFFDLTLLHEEYLNLPGVKGGKRIPYMQYLDIFDQFVPPKCTLTQKEKLIDEYFGYVGNLAQYLEGFMRRTKPLENLDQLFQSFDDEFAKLWEAGEVPGWSKTDQGSAQAASAPTTEGTGEGVWCADCAKEFKNDNVYRAHLTGKKHINNAKAREQRESNGGDTQVSNGAQASQGLSLKQRAIAEREHKVRKLSAAMQTEREDTRVNVERKAGMTDRERQQELAALFAEDTAMAAPPKTEGDGEEDDEEKIYNPLKLPIGWDGKPIPFWLYKLYGLGNEFECEICGNYVYNGRRAFEKHFSEARHIYGLKCLGITNTRLFREITQIEEAQLLWAKLERDRQKAKAAKEDVEEMEDSQGNVMPRKVYDDLAKAGVL